jgi:type I restriction-modification system DNA methylase subunit
LPILLAVRVAILWSNAYEHVIRNVASKAGKASDEFYTPAEIDSLLAEFVAGRPPTT